MARSRKILSGRKALYVTDHYQDFSDAKIAKVIRADKKLVRQYLTQKKLARTAEQNRRRRENANDPPEYRAELAIPSSCHPILKKCIAPVLIAFFVSFIVYLKTLTPVVGAEDGGELITAAYTLGIAHPPGYPLWCILGKIFATVIPFGNVAYKVNLMSAFWGAGASALLFLLSFKLTGNIPASLGASLSFAFFTDFWAQSVIAEVYTLNIFLIALLLLILVSYYHTRKPWLVWALALVSGLTLTNHNTATPIVFLAWCALLYISPKELLKPKMFLISALLAAVGLSVFLYLPIRSVADPPMDWGNPETFSSAVDHILRQQYAFSYTENPRSLDTLTMQLDAVGRLVASQGTIVFPLLAVAGLAVLWKRDKNILTFFTVVVAVCGLLLTIVINFELERESIETIKPFFLPVYLIMALFSSIAFADITGHYQERESKAFISTAAILIALVPLIGNYRENDKSSYYYAYDYGMNLLMTVEQDGILFSSSDHSTFPAIYLQSVEGMRPDVIIADKYGYIEDFLYEEMPDELTSKFRKIPTPQERHMIENWIINNTERPMFFTKKRDMQDLPNLKLIPWGLTYKLVRKTDMAYRPLNDLWSRYELRCLSFSDASKDYSAHSIIGDYHFARGREYLHNNRPQEALREFDLAAEHGRGVKEVLNNLGSACAESGLTMPSIGYYLEAVKIDPNYLLAHRNLSKLHERIGDYKKAIEYQKRACEIEPHNHRAILHLAGLYELTGDNENAIKNYQKAIEMAPWDSRPFRSLGQIYLRLPKGRPQAGQMFEESLRRNPDQQDLKDILTWLRGTPDN